MLQNEYPLDYALLQEHSDENFSLSSKAADFSTVILSSSLGFVTVALLKSFIRFYLGSEHRLANFWTV